MVNTFMGLIFTNLIMKHLLLFYFLLLEIIFSWEAESSPTITNLSDVENQIEQKGNSPHHRMTTLHCCDSHAMTIKIKFQVLVHLF